MPVSVRVIWPPVFVVTRLTPDGSAAVKVNVSPSSAFVSVIVAELIVVLSISVIEIAPAALMRTPPPFSTKAPVYPLPAVPVSRSITGASLTAVTVMLRVSLSVSTPPEPVLPPSLVSMVSWTVPFMLAAGMNTGTAAEAK